MSILNDALKKAARNRRQQAAQGGAPDAPPITHAPERRPRGNRETFTVGIAVGAVLVALGAGVTLAWFTSPPAPPPLPPRTLPAGVAASGEPTAAPEPPIHVALPGDTPAAEPVAEPAVAPVTLAESPPAPDPAEPVAEPEQPVTIRLPPVAAPPTAEELEDLALRIRVFIAEMAVAGARGTGPDGRALINSRLVRVGDTVDPVLDFRLVDVAPGRLTFEDNHGRRYTRSF